METCKNTSGASENRKRKWCSLYRVASPTIFRLSAFSVVDPMHNILLGTVKLMISIWKEKTLLSARDFGSIQAQVDCFVTRPDVGRIPHKILSGFSSFTADQLKNWALIYSIIVLKPESDYNCWYVFVQACMLISSRAISQANILHLNDILISFVWCQFLYPKLTSSLPLEGVYVRLWTSYSLLALSL